MAVQLENEYSLSLCSGAGGLDIGLEKAGFRTLAQIEIDRDCAETLSATASKKGRSPQIICESLEAVPAKALRKKLGLRRGELALLAGGPPCQPFTTHGLRGSINDHRASGVFAAYLSYIEEFYPHAMIMENVDGLLSAALAHRKLSARTKDAPLHLNEMKGSFLRWLVERLVGLGYAVSWGLVEAADFGVPQYRQRAVLIAIRDGDPCYLPPERRSAARKTLREAFRNIKDPGPIQPLSERKRAIFSLIPAGGNWRNLPVRMQMETMGAAYHATGGKSGWWRRLSWDGPSPTILGMPDHSSTGLIHPDEVRCLGLFECAAVQTFPSGMFFAGSPRSQYQQVGNAVPPRLGEIIGKHIMQHLIGERLTTPKSPEWRQESANRRIGTHGWAVRSNSGISATLSVKVRPDHIWATTADRCLTNGESKRVS